MTHLSLTAFQQGNTVNNVTNFVVYTVTDGSVEVVPVGTLQVVQLPGDNIVAISGVYNLLLQYPSESTTYYNFVWEINATKLNVHEKLILNSPASLITDDFSSAPYSYTATVTQTNIYTLAISILSN
jgi:hypothetical protein